MKNQPMCAIAVVRYAVLLLVWFNFSISITSGNDGGDDQNPSIVILGGSEHLHYGKTAEILCDNAHIGFQELVKTSKEKNFKCQAITDALNEISNLREQIMQLGRYGARHDSLTHESASLAPLNVPVCMSLMITILTIAYAGNGRLLI